MKQEDDGSGGGDHQGHSDSSYDDFSTTSIDDEAVPVAAARRPRQRCARCNNVSARQALGTAAAVIGMHV